MRGSRRSVPAAAAAIVALASATALAQPLTSAFTYQGELRVAGTPAAGPYDLRFRLYTAAAGGTQVGATLCADNVSVAEGRFTVALDFGAVFAGSQRFLEIDVRADTGLSCGNTTGFVTLAPRQSLTAAPHAAFALNAAAATSAATATNATRLNGEEAAFYQNASNLNAGLLPSSRLSGTYSQGLTFSNAAGTFNGTFSGAGGGLTGLDASKVTVGSLSDTRLSANVDLLNTAQTFTAAKTFAAAPAFTAAGAPFSIANPSLVTNLNADLLDGQGGAFYQDAANLTGSLADARLSANVALLNNQQTFAGQKTFSGTAFFTNATAPFSVTSTNRVGNLNADFLDSQTGSFYQDATNLSAGTLADARLSGNIPRLNLSQTFTGQQTFSVQPVFSSASIPFLVSSTTMVANLNAQLLGGQNSGFYTNATNLTLGTLPDVRLSANIPRLNAANTFTAAANRFAEVNVDSSEANNGTLGAGVLRLGGGGSGEAIASNRTSDPNGNRFGIDLYTGFAKRLSITNAGKAGLGTASPGMSLEVAGPASYYGRPTLGVADGPHYLYMLADAAFAPSIVWSEPTALRFGTETSRGAGYVERMRITDEGDVGIAEESPAGRLHVRGRTGEIAAVYSFEADPWQIEPPAQSVTTVHDRWQSFKPFVDVQANRAVIRMISSAVIGTPFQASVTLRLYQGQGVGGALLATVTLPGATFVPLTTVDHTFLLPGVTLTAGQPYTIGLRANFIPPEKSLGWVQSSTNQIPSGLSGINATFFGFEDDLALALYGTASNLDAIVVTPGGDVGIGTSTPSTRLEVAGAILCDAVSARSSAALKKDIRPLAEAQRLAAAIAPVRYRLKDPSRGGEEIGLIAEEVDRILPELVAHGPGGEALGVKYDRIGVIAIGALHAQAAAISRLEEDNRALRERLERLERLLGAGADPSSP